MVRRQPINQFWHNVICQMVQELTHRVYSFLARRASRDDNTLAALRDRWRFINEV